MIAAIRKQLATSTLGDWWHARQDFRATRARTAFYSRFVKPGDLVFDIGANVGNRTSVFRTLGTNVIAVEPQPSCQSVLRNIFGEDPHVVVIPAAVGAEPGTATMAVSKTHVLSSLSQEWISNVTRSKRFLNERWDETITCEVTTLDQLMQTYGDPAFVKIDVEGYELHVLNGLRKPVAALSFEFTPECAKVAYDCMDRLFEIGMTEFNYSSGESMQFQGSWRKKADMKAVLQMITDHRSFGDVYSRIPITTIPATI